MELDSASELLAQLQMRHVKAGKPDSILLRSPTSLSSGINLDLEPPQLDCIFGSILHLNDPPEGIPSHYIPFLELVDDVCLLYFCTDRSRAFFWRILGAPQLVYG